MMNISNIRKSPGDPGRGETDKETEAKRLRIKKMTISLNIVSIIVCIATMTGMHFSAPSGTAPMYLKILTAFCSALPFAALYLYRSSKDPAVPVDKKKKWQPYLFISFIVPLIALSPNRFTYELHLISYIQIVKPSAAVVFIFIIILYYSLKSKSGRDELFFRPGVALFYAVLFAFGFVVTGNWVFNTSRPDEYKPEIVEIIRPYARGSKNTYYFNVEEWGPLKGINRINVPEGIYNKKKKGDTITIFLHKGLYNIQYHVFGEEAEAGEKMKDKG